MERKWADSIWGEPEWKKEKNTFWEAGHRGGGETFGKICKKGGWGHWKKGGGQKRKKRGKKRGRGGKNEKTRGGGKGRARDQNASTRKEGKGFPRGL